MKHIHTYTRSSLSFREGRLCFQTGPEGFRSAEATPPLGPEAQEKFDLEAIHREMMAITRIELPAGGSMVDATAIRNALQAAGKSAQQAEKTGNSSLRNRLNALQGQAIKLGLTLVLLPLQGNTNPTVSVRLTQADQKQIALLAASIAPGVAPVGPLQPEAKASAELTKVRAALADLKAQFAKQQEVKKQGTATDAQNKEALASMTQRLQIVRGALTEGGLNALPESERKQLLEELGKILREPTPEGVMKRIDAMLSQASLNEFMQSVAALDSFVPGRDQSPFIDLRSAEGTEKLIVGQVRSEFMEKSVWEPLRKAIPGGHGNRVVEVIQTLIIGGIQAKIANYLSTSPLLTRLEGTAAGEYIEQGRRLAKDMHQRMALDTLRRQVARERGVSLSTLSIDAPLDLGVSQAEMKLWNSFYDTWAQGARALRLGNTNANVGRMPSFSYDHTTGTSRAVEHVQQQQKKLDTANRTRGGLDFGAAPHQLTVNNASPRQIQYRNRTFLFKVNSDGKLGVQIDGGRFVFLHKGDTPDTGFPLTNLALRAADANDDAGYVKLLLNEEVNATDPATLNYWNLGYVVTEILHNPNDSIATLTPSGEGIKFSS